MSKKEMIRVLKLESVVNLIDLEDWLLSDFEHSYRLKEYLKYENREVPTGNYYEMEKLVRLLRSKTESSVDASIQTASYSIVTDSLDTAFEFKLKGNYDLQPMISQEKSIGNVNEIQKGIQKLQVIIPDKLEVSAKNNEDFNLFEEALVQIVNKVQKRNKKYEKIKLQKAPKYKKAVGVLSVIIGISMGAVTIAGASNYILEQQQEQRAKYYKDLEEYNPRDHSPEHGPLYSAQEILEQYELEQQYLEEQQNNFEEGKTR